ncbi:MAG: barnase inhibitor [Actinomycetales bacterium]|nr:MAG: barnase inhibitor [Actinomycetales bacterium]
MKIHGPDTDVGALTAAAEHAGRQVFLVTGALDRHSALVAFAEALALPDWFGNNLDALADALRDLGDDDRPVTLVWDSVALLRRTDRHGYAALRSVLADIDAERADLDVDVVLR